MNADVIAGERWPDSPAEHADEAARVASDTRSRLIDARLPFIAETVFSHPSELDLVRDALRVGYTVNLHVVMVTEDLAVVYDNTADVGPRVVARFTAGLPVGPVAWPDWTPPALTETG